MRNTQLNLSHVEWIMGSFATSYIANLWQNINNRGALPIGLETTSGPSNLENLWKFLSRRCGFREWHVVESNALKEGKVSSKHDKQRHLIVNLTFREILRSNHILSLSLSVPALDDLVCFLTMKWNIWFCQNEKIQEIDPNRWLCLVWIARLERFKTGWC